MTFRCDYCNQDRNFDLDFKMCIANTENKTFFRVCRFCRSGSVSSPDVYWDGKPEENLADDPATGQPRVFPSKAAKAAYLRERGLQEAGDSVHGAPLMLSRMDPQRRDSREEVKMALKHIREMGQDRRKQEYLRIVKEGQRHA